MSDKVTVSFDILKTSFFWGTTQSDIHIAPLNDIYIINAMGTVWETCYTWITIEFTTQCYCRCFEAVNATFQDEIMNSYSLIALVLIYKTNVCNIFIRLNEIRGSKRLQYMRSTYAGWDDNTEEEKTLYMHAYEEIKKLAWTCVSYLGTTAEL